MSGIQLPVLLAQRLREAARQMRAAFEKMPAERQTWSPEVEGNRGRDALDQVLECAYVNAMGARAFQTGHIPEWDSTDYRAQTDARRSPDAALQWLQESTDALAAAVESRSEEQLATKVRHPFAPQDVTLAELTDLFYWNTVYHIGQINYIQTLYGDRS
ncbi:MAG: DinB family protein [Chloroherpetonaceae bacterium]|nr:hypothetical protein [Chthonomonadaceae bacterium]MDW8206587.1 DinB family protein [Chloroherpetonaceae bacterium]